MRTSKRLDTLKDYWLIEMCGRIVVMRDIERKDKMLKGIDLRKCPDCGANSTVIVFELEFTKTNPNIWGYCGKCEIGG